EGRQIDKAEVSELKSDNALARNPDGEGDFKVTPKPTPGYPNTDTGYDDFIKNHSAALGELYISEASNANYSTIKSVLGNYYDWIELHNASDRVINLEDYGLTTNTSNPAMWRFPDKDINPGEYMVVMASGANQKKTDQPYLHTNFRLSAKGELVALFDKNGNFLDKVGVEGLRADMSYGRKDSNPDFYYFGTPTPGAVNTDGAKQTLSVPQFTLPAGKYAVAQQVEIMAVDGAQIYYTTDGSDPGKNDKQYTGPITISTPTPLRARAYEDGYLPSIIATATYLIDTLPTLPIVCLTTDPPNLFDPVTGIYEMGPNASAIFPYKGANFKQDWERPVHFEYIDEDGKFCVGVDAAIRITGGYGRAMEQKGFAILTRQQYGSTTIPYAFFDTRPFTEYKDLVLRASGQDQPLSRIRDVLLSSLVDGQMDVDVQAFKQCVVYINGKYWGVYNLREKINEYFIAQHYNVDPADVDLLKYNGIKDSEIIAGTNADWKALIEYVGAHDLSIQENYDYIASQIDVDNYIDYLVTEVFTANSDQANIKYWKEHKPGAKWRWILYDFCWGFFNVDHDSMQEYFSVEGTGYGNGLNNSLPRGLLKNDGFRQKFLERFAYHLQNTFSKERVLEKIHELAGNIDEEMKRDRVRWPRDGYGNSAGTYETWKSSQIKRLETFAEKREGWVLWSIKKYFNYTDEQMKEIFGKAGTRPPSSS
ncbi:MAG: CotH kinase family protein, partial [Bacillota bacterium]|nr:CotH kinase family protein [Bacillota bacterium]